MRISPGATVSGLKHVTPDLDIRLVANPEAAAQAALALLLEMSDRAIRERGRFVLALSGGRTPERLYQLLAQQDLDWGRWQLLYGDERCLRAGDSGRTSTMVEESWLNKVAFPVENHHVPPVESGAAIAAARYGEIIAPLLPIDFALQGMGEDGHTGSLFPGDVHPDQAVIPVFNSPKPPRERISLSYATLNRTRLVCFLVTGGQKATTLARWQKGEDLPVARIHGVEKTVLITDSAPGACKPEK